MIIRLIHHNKVTLEQFMDGREVCWDSLLLHLHHLLVLTEYINIYEERTFANGQ